MSLLCEAVAKRAKVEHEFNSLAADLGVAFVSDSVHYIYAIHGCADS